tara:strand:- start:3460 stop:3819 length:360 start_codon:yes stop_codon:yes gene_type:complete
MTEQEKEWKEKAEVALKKSVNGGIKFDDDKPDYSLIPPNALDDVAKVLTIGAKKYDRHNWKKLDDINNRYFAAAQRHMWSLLKDEEHDPETGIHHAAHAICCMMFILEFYYLQKEKDSV